MHCRLFSVLALTFTTGPLFADDRELPPPAFNQPPGAESRAHAVPREALSDESIVVVFGDVLAREPTPRELRDFRDQARMRGWQADDLRRELRGSAEFRRLAPETVIRRAYRELLDREPDLPEMRRFRRQMVDEGWTPGQVRQALRESEEYRTHAADLIIVRAYEDLLERPPDPAGLEHFRRLILRQGYTEQLIRSQIRESVEYRVTLPDTKTVRAYREILGRDPDPRGLEHFRKLIVDARWTLADVENDLRRSAEYRNRPR